MNIHKISVSKIVIKSAVYIYCSAIQRFKGCSTRLGDVAILLILESYEITWGSLYRSELLGIVKRTLAWICDLIVKVYYLSVGIAIGRQKLDNVVFRDCPLY